MNNPFEYTPDKACDEAYRKLLLHLDAIKESDAPADRNFCRELETGKMLGVLIATDNSGVSHTLYAFSGQLGSFGFHHDGFVEPVFDYLQPDGYFKTKEREISDLNKEITEFTQNIYTPLADHYNLLKENHQTQISEYKEKIRISKEQRKTRRESDSASEAELTAMIRQSQFEKAELHRLKKKLSSQLLPVETELYQALSRLNVLKEKRHSESEALQNWLFTNFTLLNAKGESRSLKEIFTDTSLKIPPSGAGECCAPKLLQAAYRRGLHPVAIAEYWYGTPRSGETGQGEVRIHGAHYPACRGKCLPVLSWMLQGLDIEPPLNSSSNCRHIPEPEIIYENEWFCVVNKPSGMLSVPGKNNSLSVQQWLENKYGAHKQPRVAHRLDQDTSGLLIATFGQLPYKTIQTLFATRKVKKTYHAVLEGDFSEHDVPIKGVINLPLVTDILDRPRQRIDHENGKTATTHYEFISVSGNRSRVIFQPLTGRTHQLRVHAASHQGLGIPIVGDRLYGISPCATSERLHLHAQKIEFTFPLDQQHYSFETPVLF